MLGSLSTFWGLKAFQLMLVINTPASRACCSNQQLSGCAAWLITIAKVQSWFFFATHSICLSSHLLLSRSRLPDCALSYSPSVHWGRRRDLNWISPVCQFPSAIQFHEFCHITGNGGDVDGDGVCLSGNLSSVCTFSTTSRGGQEKVEEEQEEKYNCNHSWVIHESPDVGAMWLPLSPLTVLWVC